MIARPRAWAAAALLAIATPLAARAQAVASAATLDVPAAAPATAPTASTPAGTTLASASVAVRAPLIEPAPVEARADAERATPVNALRAAAGPSRSQSKALMIVGGAAFIAGAVIGDTPGTIMMIGGAGVGLYGLYQYLQ